jgi:3-hydroxyisobutyrate dehydrogenase-like beta-hydroxyacid dehydrogenase
MHVGFVGAGQLGEPMAEQLLAAGHHVRLFVRRAEVRERLGVAGAEVVPTLAEAATGVDVVITCVFDDDQLLEVSLGPDGLLAAMSPGSVLASHTTGTLGTLQRLAAEAAPRSVSVVDAPLSGTPVHIRERRLTVLLGGADDGVAAVRRAMAAYADPIIPTGALGSAMKIKLLNNALFASHVQLAATAMRLADELGIGQLALVEAVQRMSGGSTALGYAGALGDIDEFARQAAPFIAKDVRAAEEVAADLGIDLGLLVEVARGGPVTLTD